MLRSSTAGQGSKGVDSGNTGSGLKLSEIMSSHKDFLLKVLWVYRPFPWELRGSSSGEIEV